MIKRLFDIVLSFIGLIIALPFMIFAIIGIKLSSKGPIFYKAQRVGQHKTPFTMHKFRSMHVDHNGPALTAANDKRVFGFGKFLRLSKIDELPQLFDILRGKMSFVGPRPEDPGLFAKYTKEQQETVNVKPGLISPGTLYYYANEELYLTENTSEDVYFERLMPIKLELDRLYANKHGILTDIRLMIQCVWIIFCRILGRTQFPAPENISDISPDIRKKMIPTQDHTPIYAPDMAVLIPLMLIPLGLSAALIAPKFIALTVPVAGLLSYLSFWISTRTAPVQNWPLLGAFITFFGFATLHCFISADIALSFERLGKIFGLMLGGYLFATVILNNLSDKQYHIFFKTVLAGFCGGIVLLLSDTLLSGPILSLLSEDGSFLASERYRGIIIMIMCLIPLGLYVSDRTRPFQALLITATAALGWLILSHDSQTAQLAALTIIVGGLISLALPLEVLKKIALYGGFLLLLTMPFIAVILYEYVPAELQNHFEQAAFGRRLQLWHAAAYHSLEHFWLGNGLNTFRETSDFGSGIKYYFDTQIHPHNMFLQLWFEFGAIGIALIMIFYHQLIAKLAFNKSAIIHIAVFLIIALPAFGIWQAWWVSLVFLSFTLLASTRQNA